MKFESITLGSSIKVGDKQEYSYYAEKGYEITFEQGIVTIKDSKGGEASVFTSNVKCFKLIKVKAKKETAV